MKNLIQGGTPTGFGDLIKWTYESTTYQVDAITNTGFFNINGGFITQNIYDKILKDETLNIKISYKSNTKNIIAGNMYINVYFTDGTNDMILLPLDYKDINIVKSNWITIKHDYTTDADKSIELINVRVVGGRYNHLDVTEVAIYYSGSNSSTSNSYDCSEFQDKSILYGLDKDKPKLR